MNKKHKGFTLVEIAIVLTIIGLLIGGVLKGIELVDDAKVTSTIANMQASQAAMQTFWSTYKAIPGDMQKATTKIPGCNEVDNFCTNGNGNNYIHGLDSIRTNLSSIGPTDTSSSREKWLFWKHLALAGFISNVVVNDEGTTKGLPTSDIGGVMSIGYSNGSFDCNIGDSYKRGHWIVLLSGKESNCISTDAYPVKPVFLIDKKLDDGKPETGFVRAGESSSTSGCTRDFSGETIYNNENDTGTCGVSFFIK